jgi:CheY-like chemotaxis protein
MESSSKKYILVVENEPYLLSIVSDLLECQGYSVAPCNDAGQAIAKASEGRRIDLVIADLGLPGMSGCDLIRHISRIWPEAGYILATGYSQDKLKCSDRCAHRFLPKPYSVNCVLQTTRAVLDGSRPLFGLDHCPAG